MQCVAIHRASADEGASSLSSVHILRGQVELSLVDHSPKFGGSKLYKQIGPKLPLRARRAQFAAEGPKGPRRRSILEGRGAKRPLILVYIYIYSVWCNITRYFHAVAV